MGYNSNFKRLSKWYNDREDSSGDKFLFYFDTLSRSETLTQYNIIKSESVEINGYPLSKVYLDYDLSNQTITGLSNCSSKDVFISYVDPFVSGTETFTSTSFDWIPGDMTETPIPSNASIDQLLNNFAKNLTNHYFISILYIPKTPVEMNSQSFVQQDNIVNEIVASITLPTVQESKSLPKTPYISIVPTQ